MSDDNDETLNTEPSELDALKARADLLGVQYHPSIGLEKLREKVNAAVERSSNPQATPDKVVEAAQDAMEASVAAPTRPESDSERRARKKREANELVRVRISCMNPAKKEWDGEIFTAGNGVVGSFKKYVPFNTEAGWHVPRIILKQIQQRQCQIFVTAKDARGNSMRQGKLIKEFAVEILPNLTPDELRDLAQRQAMAKSV